MMAPDPWEESLGNHRAVLTVDQEVDAAGVYLEWRRHDRHPEDKQFIIIHEESGDTVENIHRYEVNGEYCEFAFGPILKKGRYHFYYLPYQAQEDYGFYSKGYFRKEGAADSNWIRNNNLNNRDLWDQLPKAKLLSYQARTDFDSFYPMEIIALQSEKDSLFEHHDEDFLIFMEDRKYPIRMLDEIPQKWIVDGPSQNFRGTAQRNEYFTFQIGVYASNQKLNDLKVEFSPLENGATSIPTSRLTCFNTGGIGPYGRPFVKRVDIAPGRVQPLWIGVDVPQDLVSGIYTGTIVVTAANALPQTIDIQIKVTNEVLTDRGDSEAWRHSRLRWLNSTLGIDDQPTLPYEPISFLGENSYGLTEKKITISENGFPGNLQVKGTRVLNRPISFNVKTANSNEDFSTPTNVKMIKNKPGILSGTWESISRSFKISGEGSLEADGYINYKIKLTALKRISAENISLEIPLRKEVAQYVMGMGLPGTTVPEIHFSKWKGPHDSFWIGNTEAGIWCELRGQDYHGPLLNLYQPEFPKSWSNDGEGGFSIESNAEEVRVIAFSGGRKFEMGEDIEFEWSMLLTPVKDINYKSQFEDRYYHNGGSPIPSGQDLKSGIKIVNLHHANNFNPHINYPFIAVDSMRRFVDLMHQQGQKVKIYYTIRELTNYTSELWALRSLGSEILGDGAGGGYPWLREHLVEGYRPQWYQWFPNKSADASIVNAPGDTRWYNYYIEGLAWLIKNVDIDGLYLDDVSYDRRTVKRIRKVLDNMKQGCLLDLHSNTGFSKGPTTQYAEFFPYMDKLWFGESFQYDQMPPANWLVEVSGIPFGHMGDMLHGGGNPWRGMVYGMTVRHPWTTEGVTCDPRSIWKVWDDFGIADSKMIGYWEEDPPITVDHSDVKVTAYVKKDQTLISIASWADGFVSVSLDIEWERLGLQPESATLVAPFINNFQPGQEFKVSESIPLSPTKGWLLILK